MICKLAIKPLIILSALTLFLACEKKREDGEAAALPPAVQAIAEDAPQAAAEEGEKPSDGDMLVFSSIGEPLNLIPAISSDSASHEIAGFIYNGLITLDKNMNIAGDLAKSWEISEDNLTITFYLRDDVLWHDGKPFTAEDVLFTHRFMIDNSTPTAYDKDFRMVASVEAPDNYTVKVSYDEPYSPSLPSWGLWIMPKHLLDGVPATKSDLQRNPVGTGPYIFKEWKSGYINLTANPKYFKGKPHIDRVMFRYFTDQSAAFMELLNGGIDVNPLTPAQYAKQTDTERFMSQYETYKYLASSYTYIGYNLRRKPFDDKRVRQALSYATPVNNIINSVMHGYATPAAGPFKPGTVWHNDALSHYPLDLAKAEELLREAGYAKNNKGVLVKDGKPLKIELITNTNTTRQQIAEVIQNGWKELGITVSIRVFEWGTFLNEHVNKGDFDALILGWTIVTDPDISPIFHSEGCKAGATLNFICYSNPDVDTLFDKAIRTFNTEERKGYYDRVQEILTEEQPYTFLYVPYALYAVSSRVRGIEPAPAGIFYNIEEWFVPKELQKYK
ncbi:MAG: peptide-binding protein [Deferribacteraceae bacterium]|jgi:peptide/nickel transport system substrate-binding protein|nr:peptide-binding protein [Deferribacteraceae bacterium]